MSNRQDLNKNRKKTPVDMSQMIYGKVPPQARELEEAVIGAIMLERDAFDIVAEILKPECFYVDAHQVVFKAFVSLKQRSQPIDTLTVKEQLQRTGELELIGGSYALVKFTKDVVSTAHLLSHAMIVKQKFMKREQIRIGAELIATGYDDTTDPFEDLEAAVKSLDNITQEADIGVEVGAGDVAFKEMQAMEQRAEDGREITGVTSGHEAIDRITLGWQPDDLVIIAARPGKGKTAFALELAKNAAKEGTVHVFSLEMSATQQVRRLMSNMATVNGRKIMTGKVEEWEIQSLMNLAVNPLLSNNIVIDDTAGVSIEQLSRKAKRVHRKKKTKLIIVDYLQLMTGLGNNREQEISSISRGLKKLAKEIHVPVIALSQLSRDIEKRTNKMPVLADLRESGAIEQDADGVWFLWNYEDDEQQEVESYSTTVFISNRKHRNGDTNFDVQGEFRKDVQQFRYLTSGKIKNGQFTPFSQPPPGGSWRPVEGARLFIDKD